MPKPCPCGASPTMKGCPKCLAARRKATYAAWYWREQAPSKTRKRKLHPEQVERIRFLIAERDRHLAEARKLKLTVIADQFNVCLRTVENIQRKRCWKTIGAKA
jgi:hypothetical protein